MQSRCKRTSNFTNCDRIIKIPQKIQFLMSRRFSMSTMCWESCGMGNVRPGSNIKLHTNRSELQHLRPCEGCHLNQLALTVLVLIDLTIKVDIPCREYRLWIKLDSNIAGHMNQTPCILASIF